MWYICSSERVLGEAHLALLRAQYAVPLRRSMEKIQMAKPQSWTKGQSGNPKGRPPKERALTRILAEGGNEPLVMGGETLTGNVALARRIWHFVTLGEITLGGTTLRAESVADWLAAVKWLYTHIDGPAQVEGDGENELVVTVMRGDKLPRGDVR